MSMSLPRTCRTVSRLRLAAHRPHHPPVAASLSLHRRTYASKRKGEKEPPPARESKAKISTDALVPGSQQKLAGAEYDKAEEKMRDIVDRFRKDVAAFELRASGRVTPALLSPVRVAIPETKGGDGRAHRIEELATVGVREGTTLLVTVFDEHTLKHIESAIFDAKLPGVVPQRIDSRTLKVPMPKATVETRNAMVTAAQRQAEEVRQLIRKQHTTSIKKGSYKKHAPELDEFQSLTNQYLSEVDKVLADMKRSASTK
ncbi:ribosome recycling factor [Daedalea quercina L-15889]|uniref:Ribosome recycling factor n=1 Tax=Daedalea quercina L-15889 TaxID=1314783 RepID=A0A165Q1B6_9APHY|nr:ribosome recycling factor [Daedalea quercina L-15889]